MFHESQTVVKQLILVASALILANSEPSSGQQLANGQAASSSSADWSPSEDSWNYWWSYSGISGPAYWGLLNLDWHMCDKGRRQSPINIETNRLVYDPHLSPLQLDDNLISGILHNDGHAIVFNASAKRQQKQGGRQQSAADTSSVGGRQLQQHEATTKPMSANRKRRLSNELAEDNSLIRIRSNTRDLSQKIDLSISQSEALDQLPSSQSGQKSNLATTSTTKGGGGGGDSTAYDDATNQYDVDEQEEESLSQDANKVQITGAGLSYSYRFEAIYFRFGLDNKQAGSEHLINSKWHSAELQILAYNSLLYRSFHEASSKPHGLLAISVLVDVFDKEDGRMNGQLEKLLAPLNEIKFRNQMAEVKELNLTALLTERSQFVTYQGSLNIPGCHEGVDWLVLNRPLYMAQSSLDLLRSISADEQKSDSASLIAGNLRPTQPSNNRPLRTNIRPPSKADTEFLRRMPEAMDQVRVPAWC